MANRDTKATGFKAPEIIAELGVNFYDISESLKISLVDAAKKMVYECKEAGIKAVKFQTYKAEKLAAENSPSYWDLNEEPITSQRELFSKFDKFVESDYRAIAEYCNEIGVEFMSTAFDFESADLVNDLVSRHKVASADITNFPLLEKIASFGKPIILSTGASTFEDVSKAVEYLVNSGCQDLTLLHCVLSYPTALKDVNLWKIKAIKNCFPNCRIGYSDHSKFSLDVLTAAWLLGAEVIEKHFTTDKTLKGNDHYHAGDAEEFKQLISKIQHTKSIIGEKKDEWLFDCEQLAIRNARRGSYLVEDVKKGDKVRLEHLSFLRPLLDGVSPIEVLDYLEGEAVYKTDIQKGFLIKKGEMMLKFGKPSSPLLEHKRSCFTDNDLELAKFKRRLELYKEQPLRIRCKNCDHRLEGVSFKKHGVDYVICSDCGHLNGAHEDTDIFCSSLYTDDDGKSYASTYYSKSKKAYEKRVEDIYLAKANFLLTSLKEQGEDYNTFHFVDFGAGSGYFVAALKAMDIANVEGFEASKSQVDLANAMLGEEIINRHQLDDIVDIVSSTDADVVSFIGVLEHLQHPRKVLKALKENSSVQYIFLSVPLYSPCVFFEMVFNEVIPRQLAPAHTHLYTESSIKHFCEEFSFDPVAEWWFGTDMVDLYRNVWVMLNKIPEYHDTVAVWENMFKPLVDDMQLAQDKQRMASEVHMLLKIKKQ